MITNILGWGFLLLPLVTLKQSYDAFEYPKVMVFIVLMNLILAVKFWGLIGKFKKNFRLNKIDKLLIILFLLLVISWAINGFSTVGFWGQYYRYEGLITMMAYLTFYFFISRLANPKKIQNFIAVSGIFYSFYILISGLLFGIFHRPVYTFNGRAAGTFGNPNFAAGFLALSFPYLFFHPKIKPIFKIMAIPLFLSALLFTQSRSGLIAFLIVLFLNLIKKYKYGLVVVVPLLGISLLLLFKFIPRYSPFNNQLVVWQKALIAIEKKPLFGWGIEGFDVAFQQVLIPNKDFDLYHIRVDKAHNETLEYGVAGGILAMLIYLILMVNCFKIFWQKREKKWYWTNLLALSTYLILSQLNVLNITEYIFFYFMLAVASRAEDERIIF
jgi:O-antigen ligase